MLLDSDRAATISPLMLVVERRRLIAEAVRSHGAVAVAELAAALDTSEMTVRRDLRFMARDGVLVRTHGGAVLHSGLAHEPSYNEKAAQAAVEACRAVKQHEWTVCALQDRFKKK